MAALIKNVKKFNRLGTFGQHRRRQYQFSPSCRQTWWFLVQYLWKILLVRPPNLSESIQELKMTSNKSIQKKKNKGSGYKKGESFHPPHSPTNTATRFPVHEILIKTDCFNTGVGAWRDLHIQASFSSPIILSTLWLLSAGEYLWWRCPGPSGRRRQTDVGIWIRTLVGPARSSGGRKWGEQIILTNMHEIHPSVRQPFQRRKLPPSTAEH